MDAGKLNRRVTILVSTVDIDPMFKTQKMSWSELATVWAEVQDVLPSRSEKMVDVVKIASRPCRVRMRRRSDLTSAMRLRIGGLDYRIVAGPAEIDNRTGIEVMAEALTTEGDDG